MYKFIKNLNIENNKIILSYLLLVPTFGILVSVVLYPFIYAILLSFQSKYAGSPARFIGVENFIELILDESFLKIMYNTIFYTFFGVFIKFMIGLISALILNEKIKFVSIFRTILFIPWAVPTVISSFIWLWIYDDFSGLLNHSLQGLNLTEEYYSWLADPNLAMWSLIAVVVWNGTPFYTMHFLAGLQAISKELYEAAEIDGAGIIGRFYYITLPSLKDVFTITIMLSTVFTSTSIVVVNLMTNGAPSNNTQIIPNWSYNYAIDVGRMGMGSAINIMFFPFLVIMIIILTRRMLKK